MLFWSCKKWVCTYISVCVCVHICIEKLWTICMPSLQQWLFLRFKIMSFILFVLFFSFFFFFDSGINPFEKELETWNPCWQKTCVRIWLMNCLLIPYRPYNLNPWLRVGAKEFNVFGDICKYKAVFSVWRKRAEKDIGITARLLREISKTSDTQMPWPLWQKVKN